MNRIKLYCLALLMAAAECATAGGLLTNTNQNVAFLRNPARDAAIGIDGVYSNPAGVVFLGEGFHLSLNIQNAHQTRTVNSICPFYQMGKNNGGQQFKTFEGKADAPIIPSLQAAYNKGRWSFQFGFSLVGGGGKCEYENGIPTFESGIAGIAYKLQGLGAVSPALGVSGYDMNAYMQGRQYYYGFTLGAAYKLTDQLSVYGGVRMLYGDASYQAKVNDIRVKTNGDYLAFSDYLDNASVAVSGRLNDVAAGITQVQQGIATYEAAGVPVPEDLTNRLLQLQGTQKELQTTEGSINMLEPYRNGVNLMCDQTAWGVAPIIGIDYKTGNLNLAAKYEFKTRMRMKNKSTVKEASLIEAVNRFRDGETVADDSPALLTMGAQYSICPNVRVMAGWHHYFDVDTKQFTKDMLGDSNEYLLGAEWDINSIVQVSAGGQRTKYNFNDEGMNDISFNVSSYSVGFGVGVNVSEKVKINAAYFQTFYDDYNKGMDANSVTNSFTRTNRVIGVGVDLKL